MDAIVVLMQVGRPGNWTDRGLPEVVTGYLTARTAVAAGAAWMYDTHAGVIGDDWRLLVWTNVRDGRWSTDKPDAIVTPGLYRAAIAERHLPPLSMRRRQLEAPPVMMKIRADKVTLGMRVLVTSDKQSARVRRGGPWYAADFADGACVATRVNKIAVLTRGETETLTLIAGVGDIGPLEPSDLVIPVEEQD